jgi:CRP/FNR family transcriptional regulator, cyclic AMP receptor protein
LTYSFNVFGPPLATCPGLTKMTRFEEFRKGEAIINATDDSDSVYFILKGRVKVSNFSEKGREIWHYELGPGRVFGELAALSGAPRTANVKTQAPTTVAILSKPEFITLIRNEPDIALWMLEDMASRLGVMTRKVYELVSQNVRVRIHSEILALCPIGIVNGSEYWITPMPVWAEIARRANTDRESVSREVSTLIKCGVLRRDSGSLVIVDRDFLLTSQEN